VIIFLFLESVVVEIQLVNPLKVMLLLTEVSLLWTFLPTLPGTEKPQLITNEVLSNVKVILMKSCLSNFIEIIDMYIYKKTTANV
jgi:hypothetical protein